jgi:hypothetical protein
MVRRPEEHGPGCGSDPHTGQRAAVATTAPGVRLIEVKAYGRSARGQDLWLEPRRVEAGRNPDFYINVVENVRQGDPASFTLRVLGGETLRVLLQRRREQRYSTVPWPVKVYDETPRGNQ